jgi:hypothetical protein
MAAWIGALTAGWSAFRDNWLNADPQQQWDSYGDFDAFSQWEARKFRYDLMWGMYQNNTFRDLAHTWSPSLRAAFALYKNTRHVFNPTYRLTEFWATHLYGGPLEKAIPIEGSQTVKDALAKLWRDSRFAVKKANFGRFGSLFGDPILKIVDDPVRRQVSMQVLHPGHLKWLELDDAGVPKSYIIERTVFDPRSPRVGQINPLVDPRGLKRVVRYNEEAFIDGGDVVYKTFLNGAPFNWRGYSEDGRELPPEWRVPYDFIPLAPGQHIDIGLPFGIGEPHSVISKVFEVDDHASGLGDQIRKAIRAPKMVSGLTANPVPVNMAGGDASQGNPNPSRQEMTFLGAPADARVYDLTYDLKIDQVVGLIAAINAEIERDYPELQMDIWASGDTSGRALKVARQRVESKVQERRPGYDATLTAAQRIAMAIGGIRGYPGYEGLAADPREYGTVLDHTISHRPVFAPDPMDDIEEATAFWGMAGTATATGYPLEMLLEDEGYPPARIAKFVELRDEKQAKDMEAVKAKQRLAMGDGGDTEDDADFDLDSDGGGDGSEDD